MAGIDELYADITRTAIEVLSNNQNERTLNFVFITDLHHGFGGNQLSSARIIGEIAKDLPLDFILCGGDISINGPKTEVVAAQREMTAELAAAGVPLLMVKGNHDDNSIYDYELQSGGAEHVVYPDETREITLGPVKELACFNTEHPMSLYYYVDIPHKKTRVIVLDCTDFPYTHKENGELALLGQWHYIFSAKQLSWLADEALAFPNKADWRVLIASHVPILQEDIVGTDHAVRNDEALWGILKAFREGGTYVPGALQGAPEERVEADFSKQGPGTVIGCLFGHVHYDQVVYKDGIPMVSTLNACTHQEFADSPERVGGTDSEFAFDIMTADFEHSRISAYRMGAGMHRNFTY
ncbi:metallophosphoesterase family protein [Paenibacillus paridis]|uniref:metallophosphoesterase family protein n=1 Tax=Paenibacillus paridis TaxID=2583376 RepID=UPI001120689E|nr:metallophosphoesterase [Paenibacillus paridis]